MASRFTGTDETQRVFLQVIPKKNLSNSPGQVINPKVSGTKKRV